MGSLSGEPAFNAKPRGARWARRVVVLALLAVVQLLAPAAASKPTQQNRQQALKLGGEALDLYQAGDFEAALDKFTTAHELVPAPTLKLHIARCLDKLDRMKEAAEKYRELIATELKAWAPAVHRKAREKAVPELAALLEQTPSVAVVTVGPGSETAVVTMEGETLPSEVLGEKQALDPGHYKFEATNGKRIVVEEVDLERGQALRVTLTFKPIEDSNPPVVPPKGGDDQGELYRIAGWVAVGVGGAGLVMGSVAGIVVLNQESDLEERCSDRKCPPEAHDDARAFDQVRAVSTAGFIIGGVGVAAGITLLLLAPDDEASAAAGIRPFLTLGGAGITGSF